MLKLFQSIFGGKASSGGKFDPALVQAAIDRAIDATDPRVRSLSGHRKRLEPAILRALEHVLALQDAMPPRIEASRKTYGEDERLAAFFASADRMAQVFGADRALIEFLQGPSGVGTDPVIALLAMDRTEKKVLGMAVQNDRVQQEVAQIQVSFDKHRLLDPSATEDEHRRFVMRRAFDQLLTLALARISMAGGEREALAAEQSVLRAKLRALQSAGWGLTQEGGEEKPEPATIEAKLADVEKRLQAVGSGAGTLPLHLDLLADTLEKAPEQLRIETVPLLVDRLGIRQAKPGGTTVELRLTEVRNAAGQSIVVLPLAIARDEIPKRDVMSEIRRELG
ncbi:MAG: hypothetical protein OEX21_00230 [Betaproteobacteria bacterium]|nr:hypothetical protein [Betaproteobacteria bacterium]